MASNIQNLQNQFPEMTQSVLGDVLKTYNNDADQAARALRGIEQETKQQNEKKIKELQELFPAIRKNVIVATLEVSNWDVEAALGPLFEKSEELAQESKKKQEMEVKRQREVVEKQKSQEAAKKQASYLLEVFKNIPQEKVQQLLDENEGDIEETTTQLLQMIAKQEEEKKHKKQQEEETKRFQQEQEQRVKDLKMQALRDKFEDLPEIEIVRALDKTGWDIKKALAELLPISVFKKKRDLKVLFQNFQDEEIESILEESSYDKMKAVKRLTVLREQRKKEEEEALAARQKEEIARQQQAKSKVEVVKQEPLIKEEKKEAPLGVVIKKVKQNVLERSVVLQMLEDEITASHMNLVKEEEKNHKLQQEVAQAMFKNNLEHIIESQARLHAFPGVAPPPLPKQIDQFVGKKSEPIVDHIEAVVMQERELPTKIEEPKLSESTAAQVKCSVALVVKNAVVDTGNNIVVEWEMTSGVSNAWDWIGIFPCGNLDKQYISYQWAGKQLAKGTLTFVAPSVYGQYELRYFPNGYYQSAARSNAVKVGPQFELVATVENNLVKGKWKQISGNSYPRSWMGLYEKSETNNSKFLIWEYTSKSSNNELIFQVPFKPREYELRFFSNSYVDVARSNTFRIEGQDTMTACYDNGMVTVNLNIVSVDPYYESAWLGLYFTHENNNRQWRRYKYFSNRTSAAQFKAPRTGGEYEVRLFANKTYDLLLKSNTFTIPSTK